MRFDECKYPPVKGDSPAERRARARASRAAFFGAVPFGLALWLPMVLVAEPKLIRWPGFAVIGVFLLCLLPLAPFAIAMRWVDREGWWRVLSVLIPGLLVGAGSVILVFLAGLVLVPAGLLGLLFGLMALWPCWSQGDAAGRAMALLGLAPSLLFLGVWFGDKSRHNLAPDAASRFVPWLTVPEYNYCLIVAFLMACIVVVTRPRRSHPLSFKPTLDWEDFDRP